MILFLRLIYGIRKFYLLNIMDAKVTLNLIKNFSKKSLIKPLPKRWRLNNQKQMMIYQHLILADIHKWWNKNLKNRS